MSLGTQCPSAPLRVAVLSDDRLFTEGLVHILSTDPSIVIAATEDKPHILLADSRMNGQLNSLFKMCAVLHRDGRPSVIFVAAPDDDGWASDALSAGARGVLLKTARPEDLLQALRIVQQGLIWAPRRIMAAVIDHLVRTPSVNGSAEATLERRLSSREREVARHAVRGACNKELADRLAISEATVKVHMTRIFQKLGLQSRAELAAAYYGLIPVDAERPAYDFRSSTSR